MNRSSISFKCHAVGHSLIMHTTNKAEKSVALSCFTIDIICFLLLKMTRKRLLLKMFHDSFKVKFTK